MMSSLRPKVQIAFPAEPHAADEVLSRTPRLVMASGPKKLLSALLLIALAAASAAPAARGEFLLDDDIHITSNLALRSWSGLIPIWKTPWRMPQAYPVTYSALLFQYRAFQASPFGYRVVSLLLHAACAALLWILLRKLDVPGALLAAALFAAHPVTVAAVAWVSQQKFLLCGVFLLSSLIVYFRFNGLNPSPQEEGERAMSLAPRLPQSPAILYALSMLLFVLALLSQASAVAFVPIVLVVMWWKMPRITRRDLMPLILPAILSVMWAAVIIYVERNHNGARGVGFPSLLRRLQLIVHTVWFDLAKVIFPIGWSFAYPKLDAPLFWSILPALALLGIAVAAWRLRHRIPRGAFVIAALYLILLAPMSGIVNMKWMSQSFAGDHLLYLACAIPLIGVAALATRLLESARPIAMPAIAVLVCTMLAISCYRASLYAEQETLWNHTLSRNPRSAVALNHLGLIALDRSNDAAAAQRRFRQALLIDAGNRAAHLGLARAFAAQNQNADAISEYHLVLALAANDEEARFGLASALARQGDWRSAMREYEQLLKSNPHHTRALHNRGEIQFELGDNAGAIASYLRAIKTNPSYVASRVNLANVLFQTGKPLDALDQLEAARAIDPSNYEVHVNAGFIFGAVADSVSSAAEQRSLYDRANQCFLRAANLKPDAAAAHVNRGKVLIKASRLEPRERAAPMLDEAVSSFQRAAALLPESDEVRRLEQLASRERDARNQSR